MNAKMIRTFFVVLASTLLLAGFLSPLASAGSYDNPRDNLLSQPYQDVYRSFGIGTGSVSEKLAYLPMVAGMDFPSSSSRQGFAYSRVYLPCRF